MSSWHDNWWEAGAYWADPEIVPPAPSVDAAGFPPWEGMFFGFCRLDERKPRVRVRVVNGTTYIRSLR